MSGSTRGTPTLLGLPYDASSSFLRGSAAAPPVIRRALASPAGNRWTETGADVGRPGALVDRGDVALDAPPAEARSRIETAVRALLQSGGRPILLGGDHSITYPIVRAMRSVHPHLSLLHIDAHPDLYPEFEGDRYSHACPFARILEEGLVDHVVQVGIRTMTAVQRAQADAFGVRVIEMREWIHSPRIDLVGPVYVSLDVDAFDPAFAPGVSHPEPGGLSTREVLALLHGLTAPLVGADVVEFNPTRDEGGATAALCAKLVKELAGKMIGDARYGSVP